jgi:hypothetical protein
MTQYLKIYTTQCIGQDTTRLQDRLAPPNRNLSTFNLLTREVRHIYNCNEYLLNQQFIVCC